MRPRLSVTRNTTPDPAVRLHGHRDLRKLEGIPACIFQFGQGGITLPFGDGLPGHTHFFSQLFLGKAQLAALGGNGLADGHGGVPPLLFCCPQYSAKPSDLSTSRALRPVNFWLHPYQYALSSGSSQSQSASRSQQPRGIWKRKRAGTPGAGWVSAQPGGRAKQKNFMSTASLPAILCRRTDDGESNTVMA